MRLSDVRDYIDSLGLADSVYMSRLPQKKDKSIGVYHARRNDAYATAVGGKMLKSYGVMNVAFLVHWNKSPRETDAASKALFRALEETREATINTETIKFIQLLYNEPVDVDTDEDGICEMVIDAAVVYQRK